MSEPTMNEPKVTTGEMKQILSGWYRNCKETAPDCASQCSEELFLKCEETYKTIRRLIEGRPRVDWMKWQSRIKDDYNLGPMHILYLIQEMFKEMGINEGIPIFNEEGNSNEGEGYGRDTGEPDIREKGHNTEEEK